MMLRPRDRDRDVLRYRYRQACQVRAHGRTRQTREGSPDQGCLTNIECKVVDLIEKHNIVVLEAAAAYVDAARKERRGHENVGHVISLGE